MTESLLRLEPGEPCIVFRETRNSGGTAHIKADTIARVGKRDVVTTGGERFNRGYLSRSNGAWESPTLLLAPDDPRVDRARAANAKQRRVREIDAALEEARIKLRRHDDIDGALETLRGLLAEVSL